jgi:2-oxoglutarate/2-oxoacid ferredoxin oxidoreductase subunit beta
MSAPAVVPNRLTSAPVVPSTGERAPLNKKLLTADHPTWCPGCGDFAVLASFYRVLEKLNYPHENIVTFAGIGCSSRFPYFVNSHGGHFIHGRALPFAAGISLGRDDLHVFVFGGDGDGFSIGGNHLSHTARKNVNLTYVIMDNSVYGLTKKQTSPTSPIGFKTKTDPWGAVDQPVNPMRTLVNSGATFVARSHATQVNHMTEMMLRAAKHQGFSVVEILSECVEFFEGAFDGAIPRKGGAWTLVEEKKNDGSPDDAKRHDVTDLNAAYQLASQAWPGAFGVFYEVNRPTKNAIEADLIAKAKERTKNATDLQLLQATFAKLR